MAPSTVSYAVNAGSNPAPAPTTIEASYSYVPDPEGEVRQWIGDAAFVRVGRSSLEVSEGQLIWVGQDGIWIDTIRTTFIDPLLRSRTVGRGRMSKSAYHEAVRARVRALPVTPVETIEPLFRIYRPA